MGNLLYATIENSDGFYSCPVDKACRSRMNVPFVLKGDDAALTKQFLANPSIYKSSLGDVSLNVSDIIGDGRVVNFSAGPCCLPIEVLQSARDNMLSWEGSGSSVLEMSHRSKEYESIINQAEKDMRELLSVPNNFKILFLQ